MTLFNISKGISWNDQGHFYLDLKHDKYELLIDYLNASTIESLENDINQLQAFQVVRDTKNKEKIEEYIVTELEGFNELDNGYSAYIAGSHDLSASIQYNIESDTISLVHPNIPSLEKFIIQPNELVHVSYQMIQLLKLKENLSLDIS